MEPIELLRCITCGRTEDQWTMVYGCRSCNGKLFRAVRFTWFRVVCWAWNNPAHVWALIKQDFWEKVNEYRR